MNVLLQKKRKIYKNLVLVEEIWWVAENTTHKYFKACLQAQTLVSLTQSNIDQYKNWY